MSVLWVALLALQDKVEMKEHRSYYLVKTPAGYSDAKSWPAVVALHDETTGDEEGARKAHQGWGIAKSAGYFVIAPQSRGKWGGDFVKACVDDAKTRYRIDPLRVLLTGAGKGADHALSCATKNAGLASALFLQDLKERNLSRDGAPPIREDESTEHTRALALGWFEKTAPERSSLEIAQGLVRDGRWLDASLVCADLMDRPDVARLAKFQLSRIEGEGIMELGKVELTMTERKYVDAWARCRAAAVQFAWVPIGEKIRKRLGQLEADPRVRAARNLDD